MKAEKFSDVMDFSPGRAVYEEFTMTDEQAWGEQIDKLNEDLLQVEYPGDVLLDLGWYPAFLVKGLQKMNVQTVTTLNDVQMQPLPFIAEEARRRANSYLAQYVSTGYRAIEPKFVPLEGPIWQFVIQYKAPTLLPIRVGLLEVNVLTGEVLAPTTNQIEAIRERARAYLTCNTPYQQQLTDCPPVGYGFPLDERSRNGRRGVRRTSRIKTTSSG
jgi:hypothetical protein